MLVLHCDAWRVTFIRKRCILSCLARCKSPGYVFGAERPNSNLVSFGYVNNFSSNICGHGHDNSSNWTYMSRYISSASRS